MEKVWDKVKKLKGSFQKLVDDKMQEVANKGAEMGYPNAGAGLAAAGSTVTEAINLAIPESTAEAALAVVPVGKLVKGAKGVLKPLGEAAEVLYKDMPGRQQLVKAAEAQGITGKALGEHFDKLEKVGEDGQALWERVLARERNLKGIGTTSADTVNQIKADDMKRLFLGGEVPLGRQVVGGAAENAAARAIRARPKID
jgi:hypothetical protein